MTMLATKLEKKSGFKLPTGLLSGAIDLDGNTLIAGCMDGVYVVNLQTKEHAKIAQHETYVSSVAWHDGEKAIVSAGYDGCLKWHQRDPANEIRSSKLHQFWSWDMATSPNQELIASVTGQYLAGGYKYEPQPESEPSVVLVSAKTGDIIHKLSHTPSVQAVAFSPDSQFVAAGNLMGTVRVWDCTTGELASEFNTPDFTSWGIIKSHCYLGGIFALKFTPNGNELLLAGMGPMRDPMAGNGRQLWQKWSWKSETPTKVDETHKGESGEGLMETLAIHPDGKQFVMGGRLRGGEWNVAMFDLQSGERLTTLKTGYRVTEAMFNQCGDRLILVGTQGQPGPDKDGHYPDFGRIEVYSCV